MVSIKKPSHSGYTLIELLIIVAIIMILTGSVAFIINPVEIRNKSRDEVRLEDITTLERAVNEYVIDNGTLPDVADTTRQSNVLPEGNTGPLVSPSQGWISADLTNYFSVLPIDPVNDDTYHYTYRHNGRSYEINSMLQYYSELAEQDGGNDTSVYEVGDDLTII